MGRMRNPGLVLLLLLPQLMALALLLLCWLLLLVLVLWSLRLLLRSLLALRLQGRWHWLQGSLLRLLQQLRHLLCVPLHLRPDYSRLATIARPMLSRGCLFVRPGQWSWPLPGPLLLLLLVLQRIIVLVMVVLQLQRLMLWMHMLVLGLLLLWRLWVLMVMEVIMAVVLLRQVVSGRLFVGNMPWLSALRPLLLVMGY